MTATTKVIEMGRGVEHLLIQVGEEEYACRLCGSRNVGVEETPSMYASTDSQPGCDDCGAYETTDPFTSITTIRRKLSQVLCENCGERHVAEPAHVSETQGQIYAVARMALPITTPAKRSFKHRRGHTMETKYPNITVQLSDADGNPFAIIGKVRQALRRAGLSAEEIRKFSDEATAGDYDNVLATAMRWAEVE